MQILKQAEQWPFRCALEYHSPGAQRPFELKEHLPTDYDWLEPGSIEPQYQGAGNMGSGPMGMGRQWDTTQSGKWYHVSPQALQPGTDLVPHGGEGMHHHVHPELWEAGQSPVRDRNNYVWMSPNVNMARDWAQLWKKNWPGTGGDNLHLYEVHPRDKPQGWNYTGEEGYVAPHATVLRELPLAPQHGEGGPAPAAPAPPADSPWGGLANQMFVSQQTDPWHKEMAYRNLDWNWGQGDKGAGYENALTGEFMPETRPAPYTMSQLTYPGHEIDDWLDAQERASGTDWNNSEYQRESPYMKELEKWSGGKNPIWAVNGVPEYADQLYAQRRKQYPNLPYTDRERQRAWEKALSEAGHPQGGGGFSFIAPDSWQPGQPLVEGY